MVSSQPCGCNSVFPMLVTGNRMVFPPLQAKRLSHPLQYMPGQANLIVLGMRKKEVNANPTVFLVYSWGQHSEQLELQELPHP